MTDAPMDIVARVADWLNAFKADPFSTGADKAERLLEVVGNSIPTAQAAGMWESVREALEPFAKAADVKLCADEGYWTDDKSIQGTDVAFYVTFGDLKRAREVLAALSTVERVEWRCFHCGEVFTDRKLAEDHFGLFTLYPAACVDPLRDDERAMRERATFYEKAWRQALRQRDEALASIPTAQAAGMEELKAILEVAPSLPKAYQWSGTAEAQFDCELRHESGKKPFDYLKSWLSMLRPFAYATQDDSWGEMEKLLCIVMRNYTRVAAAADKARASLPVGVDDGR